MKKNGRFVPENGRELLEPSLDAVLCVHDLRNNPHFVPNSEQETGQRKSQHVWSLPRRESSEVSPFNGSRASICRVCCRDYSFT